MNYFEKLSKRAIETVYNALLDDLDSIGSPELTWHRAVALVFKAIVPGAMLPVNQKDWINSIRGELLNLQYGEHLDKKGALMVLEKRLELVIREYDPDLRFSRLSIRKNIQPQEIVKRVGCEDATLTPNSKRIRLSRKRSRSSSSDAAGN